MSLQSGDFVRWNPGGHWVHSRIIEVDGDKTLLEADCAGPEYEMHVDKLIKRNRGEYF